MAGIKLEIELPDELFSELEQMGSELGVVDPAEAAVIALAQCISQRKSELGDSDPEQRYFVNEALDELIGAPKKKKK